MNKRGRKIIKKPVLYKRKNVLANPMVSFFLEHSQLQTTKDNDTGTEEGDKDRKRFHSAIALGTPAPPPAPGPPAVLTLLPAAPNPILDGNFILVGPPPYELVRYAIPTPTLGLGVACIGGCICVGEAPTLALPPGLTLALIPILVPGLTPNPGKDTTPGVEFPFPPFVNNDVERTAGSLILGADFEAAIPGAPPIFPGNDDLKLPPTRLAETDGTGTAARSPFAFTPPTRECDNCNGRGVVNTEPDPTDADKTC